MSISEKQIEACRFCGAKCRVENFNSEHVEATLWICGNNAYFGGDCPHETAYLYERAWQEAMRQLEPDGDEVERVARALMEVDFGTMGDEEQDRWMAKPLGDEFRLRARAAIAALRSKPPIELSLCSHPGTCEQNMVEHGGAFCANPPIGDDVRERVAKAIGRTPQDGESSAYTLRMRLSYDEQLRAADAAITAIGSQSIEGERG